MHFAKGQQRIIIVVLLVLLLPSHGVHTRSHLCNSFRALSLCVPFQLDFPFTIWQATCFARPAIRFAYYIFVLNPHGRSETYIQLSTTRLRKEGQEGTRISQSHTHIHLHTYEYAGYRKEGCVKGKSSAKATALFFLLIELKFI